MKNKGLIIAILVVGVLVVGLTDVAVAKKKLDGKTLYRELCKPCHTADSDNGEYTPMTLIQDQWTRFFDEKYEETHSGVLFPAHDNQPVTDVISDEELEAIRDFAVKGAADSEHPMTCG